MLLHIFAGLVSTQQIYVGTELDILLLWVVLKEMLMPCRSGCCGRQGLPA